MMLMIMDDDEFFFDSFLFEAQRPKYSPPSSLMHFSQYPSKDKIMHISDTSHSRLIKFGVFHNLDISH